MGTILEIRQECQEILDADGLTDCYIGVVNKLLTVCGPCGDPLYTFKSIPLLSNISKKSKDFIINIFKTHWFTISKDIQDYVKARKHLKSLEKPMDYKYPVSKESIYNSITRSYENKFNIKYRTPSVIVTFKKYEHKALDLVGITICSQPSISDVTSILLDVNKAMPDMELCILDAAKYYEAEDKVHTIKNKLESCKL